MSREQPKFELRDYPVRETPGKYELIDAETIYYFKNDNNEGRWMFGIIAETEYGKRAVIYRFQWRRPKKQQSDDKWVPDDSKPHRWFQEQKVDLNKIRYWKKLRDFFDEVFVE